MGFFGWFLSIVGGIFLLYITVRLCSHAYYKTKRDYVIWLKKVGIELKGDNSESIPVSAKNTRRVE